ncbi:MAG: hypothetical protein ACYDDF_03200 [Thermoplasmatota archaeon]
MRFLPFAAILLLVPLAGCLGSTVPAGVPAASLQSSGWKLTNSTDQNQALIAKVYTREYQPTTLDTSYAILTVVSVTDIPVLTPRAVNSAADSALQNVNAQPAGNVTIDFAAANVGNIQAEKFTVTRNNVQGEGFRAEFSCPNAYVLVVGVGATAPLPGLGNSGFQEVTNVAQQISCSGG